jgi:hypothetical protein
MEDMMVIWELQDKLVVNLAGGNFLQAFFNFTEDLLKLRSIH